MRCIHYATDNEIQKNVVLIVLQNRYDVRILIKMTRICFRTIHVCKNNRNDEIMFESEPLLHKKTKTSALRQMGVEIRIYIPEDN